MTGKRRTTSSRDVSPARPSQYESEPGVVPLRVETYAALRRRRNAAVTKAPTPEEQWPDFAEILEDLGWGAMKRPADAWRGAGLSVS